MHPNARPRTDVKPANWAGEAEPYKGRSAYFDAERGCAFSMHFTSQRKSDPHWLRWTADLASRLLAGDFVDYLPRGVEQVSGYLRTVAGKQARAQLSRHLRHLRKRHPQLGWTIVDQPNDTYTVVLPGWLDDKHWPVPHSDGIVIHGREHLQRAVHKLVMSHDIEGRITNGGTVAAFRPRRNKGKLIPLEKDRAEIPERLERRAQIIAEQFGVKVAISRRGADRQAQFPWWKLTEQQRADIAAAWESAYTEPPDLHST